MTFHQRPSRRIRLALAAMTAVLVALAGAGTASAAAPVADTFIGNNPGNQG